MSTQHTPTPTKRSGTGARRDRTALVTGATGYVGGELVPVLLAEGWRVRVLSRSGRGLPTSWADRVEVVTGDATDTAALHEALQGVEVAYYLLHSMDGHGDYRSRDRDLATTFARVAGEEEVRRVVYLSGLHPDHTDLSDHLASRVEVGEILLEGPVPAAVLQAGVVLGDGSVSFQMLRHLTERLPIAFGPKWLDSEIQPIAVVDVLHYLLRAADLPAEVNRTFDIGMGERMSYLQMMERYAAVTGLGPRVLGTVPVLTPMLASYWIGLITPVDPGVARPLVGSLVHDAVVDEDDAGHVLGHRPEGVLGFDDAVLEATRTTDPHRWARILRTTIALVGTASLAERLLAGTARSTRATGDAERRGLMHDAALAVASASGIADLHEAGDPAAARAMTGTVLVDLALGVATTAAATRGMPATAVLTGAVRTLTATRLSGLGARTGALKGLTLAGHAAWAAGRVVDAWRRR